MEVGLRRDIYFQLLDCIKNDKNSEAQELLERVKKLEGYSFNHALILYAVHQRNAKMVDHIIKAGCDVNAQNENGLTALMLAIQSLDVETVKVLLLNHADIFLITSKNKSSLDVAADHHLERSLSSNEGHDTQVILKVLFDKLNNEFLTNNHTTSQYLLKAKKLTKFSCLIYGSVELTRFVLENCYSAKFKSNVTNLEQLLTHGNIETVETILKSDTDLASMDFSSGQSILHLLIRNRNKKVLDLFIKCRIPFNVNALSRTGTALITAVRLGVFVCLEKCEFLLEHGIDVNLIALNGESALYHACEMYVESGFNQRGVFKKIIALLLFHGADPQFVSINEKTVLDPFSYDDEEKTPESVDYIILAHFALLEEVDNTLKNIFRIKINSNTLHKNYFNLCTKQLQEMKNINVLGTLTFSKLLAVSNRKWVVYARNPDFLLAFQDAMKKAINIEKYYSNLFHKKGEWAIKRAKLEKESITIIEKLTRLCSIAYHYIIYNIFSFLKNDDLKNLCQVDSTLPAKE